MIHWKSPAKLLISNISSILSLYKLQIPAHTGCHSAKFDPGSLSNLREN